MSIAPKLSYHHSIFPIGFKIPLIIEQKYLEKTYNVNGRNFMYIEPNIHGIHISNFQCNDLPLIYFKEAEFKTWSMYLKNNDYLTYNKQFVICCEFGNLYGCKVITSLLSNLRQLNALNLCYNKAASNGYKNIIKYVMYVDMKIETFDGVSPCTFENNHLDIQYSVSSGVKIRTFSNTFVWAAENGHLNIVQYLLRFDVTADLFYDKQAVKWAACNGHTNILRYLVSKGHDITVDYNHTIFVASKYGHLETVKYLVSMNMDVTASDNFAVRLASRYDHIDVVRYLVSHGADVTAWDNYAVREASYNGHLAIVRYLVSQGADITVYDNEAVRWASMNGHDDVVKYLISHGAVLPTK